MNTSRILEFFKLFGKLQKLSELGDAYSAALKAHLLATQKQFVGASGQADPYTEVNTFFTPLVRSGLQITQSLDRVDSVVTVAVNNYLRAIGPELGVTNSVPPAAALNALASNMTGLSQSVGASGLIYNFFFSTYGVALPSSNSPTISDSLITTNIIA